MNRKARTLSVEDCRAVDLLLDLGTANAQAVTRMAASASQRRLATVTQLLAKLDHLPAIELPAGLVARTMARVEVPSRRVVDHAAATSGVHLH
jgi:hypothetical protein